MAMITYPLNNIEYTAEDAELFHSTRTSGVYANNSFNYSVSGADNTVIINPGICWIKNNQFAGKVVAQKESVSLDLGLPDSNYPRIDAIVIQFDANKNASEIVIKKGTAKSNPIAPSIVRTESVYELHLYHIRRDAGALTISSGNITDLRLNANYCGLMADSVTKIDTDSIERQSMELIANLSEEIKKVKDESAFWLKEDIIPLENGGTNAGTAAEARQNINVIGLNPVTATANDTPDAWKAFGTGIAYFNKANCIVDQPTTNGLIENKVYNNTVLQEWFVRGTSPRKLIRTGQAGSGWNSSWIEVSIAGQIDYVTATGTSGAWRYWKFNSGLCIAMGQPTVAWSEPSQVVSGQTRSTAALDLSGIFTAVMGGTCSNVHRYVNCFITTSGGASAELWATTAVATSTINVSNFSTTPFVVLFGKWK